MRTLLILPAWLCAAPALALPHDGDCLPHSGDKLPAAAQDVVPAGTAIAAPHPRGATRPALHWETPIFPHEQPHDGRRQDFPGKTATLATLNDKAPAGEAGPNAAN